MRWIVFSLLIVSAATLSCSHTPAARGEQQWLDVNGVVQHPLRSDSHGPTLLLFIAPDCPISNAYAPEIARIASEYQPRNVSILAVHADPGVSAEVARKHASDYG